MGVRMGRPVFKGVFAAVRYVGFALGLGAGLAVVESSLVREGAGVAAAAEPAAPQIRAPRYPKEPGKKAPQPVKPETFVEAPSTPPSAIDANVIPRVDKRPEWATTVQITWFSPNRTSEHSIS